MRFEVLRRISRSRLPGGWDDRLLRLPMFWAAVSGFGRCENL